MQIDTLTGIGPKTAKLYNKLEIYTINDLVSFYPYRYNVYTFSNLLNSNDNIIIKVKIISNANVFYIKKNFNRLSFRAEHKNIIFGVTIFNRAFLKSNLTIGKEVTLIGKYDKSKNTFTASDIKFNINEGDIEPVYHLTKGLTNKAINKNILTTLTKCSVEDYIPLVYKDKYNFMDKKEALLKIHNPINVDNLTKAKERLKYEELFEFTFKMNYLKKNNKNSNGIAKNFDEDKVNLLIKSLPYNLTEDQTKAVNDILDDLKSNNKMNRLLLGDVGSGKTVVSMIGIYAAFLSGFQSALMAPTEILAIQHYYEMKEKLQKFNVIVDVITGSMTKLEKKKIYERLANGEIDLLIGTHSILNDEVKFNKLGLVITDEQHRFGVNQRSVFHKKSDSPDVLYLSATPIPRTYAMTIYGDLDISIIKSKPNGRKEILTKVKKESEIKDVLYSILEEIKKGHQIYVVSPLVEQNDELDLSSVNLLKEKLDLAFKGLIKSEIIHGKMKQAQKDDIMNNFKTGETKILISTTVIEVGIDVKNATMMIIFNAERFGLATLHQLRGRVGRNDLQSYCYLISDYENDRLKVMEESNDGFYISEKDFELRGHGDLFGTRQHGDMSFKLVNIKEDYELLLRAKTDTEEYIKNNLFKDNIYYNEISKELDIVD